MGDIFNLDNKFFQALGKGVDCVCLSLLWMICCIPLCGICDKSDHFSTAVYRTGSSDWNCNNSTLLCSKQGDPAQQRIPLEFFLAFF